MKKLSFLVLMMAAMFVASAQMLDPAKVSCSVKETSATEAELVVTVKLDAGWHMYSQKTDPNGPLPTVFEFEKSNDYALVGKVREPKPHEENDPLFGCVVKSFEGTVVFRQKIKRLSQKDFTVKGIISYQLCNNGSCIAPEDHDIVFKVKGATEKVENEEGGEMVTTTTPEKTIGAGTTGPSLASSNLEKAVGNMQRKINKLQKASNDLQAVVTTDTIGNDTLLSKAVNGIQGAVKELKTSFRGMQNASNEAVEAIATTEILIESLQPMVDGETSIDTIGDDTAKTGTTTTENDDNGNKGNDDNKDQSLLMIFLIALGGGVLTMFTPCVFPMIPMTVNFFMHSSENKRKGRRQAWIFGLSIVLIFSVLGVILSAFLGPEQLNTIATNWIPNIIFFLILFIFSLSFFGLFEIKMPEKWVNASDEQADKGGFLAPFFIALTTVLVSFSCTGPIIGGALVGLTTSSGADAETANRWVSLVTMLGFGIGFAAPFTLLAFFPQMLKNMKSGSWLNTVKVSFAFIELAFGLKFLQMADIDRNWGLLPRDIYLALWIVIFAMWGFYLLGKLRFKGDDEMPHVGTGRLMIAIVDFAFVVYMIPGLFGAKLEMLGGFLPPLSQQEFTIQKVVMEYGGGGASTLQLPADRKYLDKLKDHTPMGYETFYDLDEAKAYAQKAGKPIFIDFTGKNCANCRKMEENVWDKAEVKKVLTEQYVMVSLFCDENTIDLPESEWVTDDKGKVLKTLGKRNSYYQRSTFNMNAQPYYVVIDANGRRLTKNNYKFNTDPSQFVDWLNEGLNNFGK